MKQFSFLLVLLLVGCTTVQTVTKEDAEAPKELNVVSSNFSNLPGWQQENFYDFAKAYQKSCDVLLKRDSQSAIGKNDLFGKNQEWQIVCRKFADLNPTDSRAIKAFFEQNFVPYQGLSGDQPDGLFTGYYEASLRGSRTRQGPYQTPLRARPDDLVMVQLGDFRDDLKGRRIAGRVMNGKLKPYETHGEIINGQLPSNQDKALVWVDSAVDAFFLQIQGSGVVQLDDGSLKRVGYAGQNGHPYYAIGRELIARGQLTKENVSMQSIRAWLEANPSQAQEIMTTNKSYVFFEENTLDGPRGGSGLTLTPMRSLAIDHSLIPYHIPVWLSAETEGQILNRLMVTQDTGGAIRGPVRGDFFWGYGPQAEKMAGTMKSTGQYWFLLPKSL
ncbi:MAG: murein transglycosylase A [Pseudomonadota bacterium]